ncbi:MAG: hypothetical protein SFW35_11020 [Chitinophagales bacterium]|nr:hypothetical protein [Chitinophagales bacterium]
MKIILLLLCCLSIVTVYSQNVGIGTTTPKSKLDVQGGLTVGSTYGGTYAAPTNGALFEGNVSIGTTTSDINARLTLSGAVSGGEMKLQLANTATNGYTVIRFGESASGNGLAYLHRFNSTWGTSGMWEPSSIGFYEGIGNMNIGGQTNFKIFTGGTGTGNERVRVTSTGNVGIGETNPQAKLHLGGSQLINSGLSNSSTRPVVTSGIMANGELKGQNALTSADDGFIRLSAGGGTSAGVKSYIDLSGYSTIPDMNSNIVMGTSGSEKLRITNTGNVGINEPNPAAKLDVNGNLILQNGVAVNEFSTDGGLTDNSDLAIPTEQAVKTYVDTRLTGTDDWTKTGNDIYNNNSGNIGIGTSTITEKLTINGNASIAGANYFEFGKGVVGKEPNAGKIGYQLFTTGSLDIVGAGTGIRTIKLWDNVNVNTNLTMGNIIYMEGTKNTTHGLEWYYSSNADRYGITQAAGGNVALYTAAAYAPSFFSFNLANASNTFDELVRIGHDGNVGIGTTTTTAGLNVAGNRYALFGPNSSWGAYLQVGGNGGLVTNHASVAATNGNLHLDAASGAYGLYLNWYKGTGGVLFGNGNSGGAGIMTSTGYFGIGNIGPGHPLHVSTSAPGNWQGRFQNGNSNVYLAHADGYGVHINTGGTNSSGRYALEVRNASQTHLYVREDGNVSIGNATDPRTTLDVRGAVFLGSSTPNRSIKFTDSWSGFPDNSANLGSEIANDIGTYKTLMIIGNRSNDPNVRRVSVWDRLEVNGSLYVTGGIQLNQPYCVIGYRWTACPAGFYEVWIKWDTEDDGNADIRNNDWAWDAGSTGSIQMKFCCR